MSSQQHRNALLKTSNDNHVSFGTNNDNLIHMVSKVIEIHRISYSDEEFPCERVMHNKALNIAVKCPNKIVNRVLVDDGFGLNICPLSSLKKLNFDLRKIHQNQVNVRSFNGGQRETLGDVSSVLK